MPQQLHVDSRGNTIEPRYLATVVSQAFVVE